MSKSGLLSIFKGVFSTIAPTIATALGGPLAGMAVGTLSKALLGKPDGTPDEVGQALSGISDPQTLEKLKEAEQQFAEQMRSFDIDLAQIAEEDRVSARGLAATTVQGATTRNLAYTSVAGFFAFCLLSAWMIFRYGPSVSEGILTGAISIISMIIGWLGKDVAAVYALYFGASSQNETNQATLTANLKTMTQAVRLKGE